MNHKYIFIKIYTLLLLICSITLITFHILGIKTRTGYLSEFNLDIDKTLKINNLDTSNTKNLFIIDNELDQQQINNYIYTNNSITNYIYNFNIKYHTKVFRHSDIYYVYPNTNKVIQDNDYIKNIDMPIPGHSGSLTSIKKLDANGKIDNINYYLKLKENLLLYLFILIIIDLIIFVNIKYKEYIISNKKNNIFMKYDNFFNEKKFIILIILTGFILFLFHFWLSFPGYFSNPDNIVILKQSVLKNYSNWHPVIIQVTLNILYKIFGQNSFYLTLINLICLYLGLTLIILALYIKIKNRNIIFLFFINLIPNFYLTIINQLKDITASMYLWLACCIVFFIILIPIQKRIYKLLTYSLLSLILILSLLWRHNMIVSIYPIVLLLIMLIIKNINIKSKLKNIFMYISISLLAAIILIFIVKITPYLFIKEQKGYYKNVNVEELYSKYGYVIDYFIWMDINDNFAHNAANNIFFLQIAACAVPNNDGSLIPNYWYEKGKNFEDLKNLYSINKFDADSYGAKWREERIFNSVYLDNISKVWLSYIKKYPKSYFNFLCSYFIKWLSLNITWLSTPNSIPEYLKNYGFKDYDIPFNDLRLKLYKSFYINATTPISLLFIISVAIFLSSIVILIKFQCYNNMLLYSLFLSFSSLATFFIVVIFSFIDDRYMYPMFITTILSIISSIVFIYDIGGIKQLSTLKYQDKI